MKKIFIALLFTTICQQSFSQTFAEWFEQKKTQIEYLLNQIAAFKAYTDDLEKTYETVKKGTDIISAIKNGEFNLHSLYFSSLKTVNPAIKSWSETSQIISYELFLLNDFKKIRKAPHLNPQELEYVNRVYQNLISSTATAIGFITDLLTNGVFEMKDDERIKNIDRVYQEMKDKYSFARDFSDQVLLLSRQRQADLGDVKNGFINYGIK